MPTKANAGDPNLLLYFRFDSDEVNATSTCVTNRAGCSYFTIPGASKNNSAVAGGKNVTGSDTATCGAPPTPSPSPTPGPSRTPKPLSPGTV
eukprot:tig00020563_g11308.t1